MSENSPHRDNIDDLIEKLKTYTFNTYEYKEYEEKIFILLISMIKELLNTTRDTHLQIASTKNVRDFDGMSTRIQVIFKAIEKINKAIKDTLKIKRINSQKPAIQKIDNLKLDDV